MKIYFTRGINNEVANNKQFAKEIVESVKRYCRHDFGDLCDDDKKMNEDAIKYGGRILAVYNLSQGKVYIITDDTKAKEWVTTVLFASEY